jgi:glycosyltransferase involved in cell wall biosynthesis
MDANEMIIYIRPASGGIASYAEQIEAIYHQQGLSLETVSVAPETDLGRLVYELSSRPASLYHLEIGAGDGLIFELSRRLLKASPKPQLVTVHDPGVVVQHPIAVRVAASSSAPVRFVGKVLRKLAATTLGRSRIRRWLNSPRLTKLYLRPDIAETTTNAYYLPHPTFHPQQPEPTKHAAIPQRLGFGGYWGLGKGLETLAEAWSKVDPSTGLSLTIAGAGAAPNDPYDAKLRAQLKALPNPPALPGFIAGQLDAFLTGLDVLILPYWPTLPSGTSGMALRAAELGVPIVASSIPALTTLLGPNGAIYVEPQNAPALSAAILKLTTDWSTIKERADRSQEAIFAAHSWKVVGAQLQGIIAATKETTR